MSTVNFLLLMHSMSLELTGTNQIQCVGVKYKYFFEITSLIHKSLWYVAVGSSFPARNRVNAKNTMLSLLYLLKFCTDNVNSVKVD